MTHPPRLTHLALRPLLPLLLAALLPCWACTRNNGDIGPLFGTWCVESIHYGDTTEECRSAFICFQSSVVMVETLDTAHQSVKRWGTWALDDGGAILVLDFSHSDSSTSPSTGQYAPPTGLHLASGATGFTFTVASLAGGAMTLQYLNPDDNILYTYRLKKW